MGIRFEMTGNRRTTAQQTVKRKETTPIDVHVQQIPNFGERFYPLEEYNDEDFFAFERLGH